MALEGGDREAQQVAAGKVGRTGAVKSPGPQCRSIG